LALIAVLKITLHLALLKNFAYDTYLPKIYIANYARKKKGREHMPKCEGCGREVRFIDMESFEGKDVCALCKSIMERNKAEKEYFEAKKRKLDEE
jgi:hypothetical protein